uniref:Uncharacterized protein n=1 Tax=Sphaerodactylus townsendi TaxID=933632 RepID=A0ACB8E733_9SAUR
MRLIKRQERVMGVAALMFFSPSFMAALFADTSGDMNDIMDLILLLGVLGANEGFLIQRLICKPWMPYADLLMCSNKKVWSPSMRA